MDTAITASKMPKAGKTAAEYGITRAVLPAAFTPNAARNPSPNIPQMTFTANAIPASFPLFLIFLISSTFPFCTLNYTRLLKFIPWE